MTHTGAPVGYQLLLPPGWVRVPLRRETREALEELVFARLKRLPPEVPKDHGMKYRMMVRRTVTEQVEQARQAGGLDLYLPLTGRHGTRTAGSFLVSEVPTGPAEPIPPEALLARIAADVEGVATSTRELAGTLTVRREYVRPAAADREVCVHTRHVEYVLPVPDDPRRFVSVAFSTPGNGDPDSEFTRAVADLFDAVMTTFRWVERNEGSEPTSPEQKRADR